MKDKDQKTGEDRVTIRSFVLGAFLAGLFAWITVIKDNSSPPIFLSKNMIPVLPYMALFLIGILVNPILKAIRIIRPFSVSEKLQILVMCAVSAGITSFGLVGHLVPLISGLSHPSITNKQTNRDIHAMPYLNEGMFIIEDGARERASLLKDAHLAWENARKTFRVATDMKNGEDALVLANEDLQKAKAEPSASVRNLLVRKINYSISKSSKLVEDASVLWDELGQGLDRKDVIETYPIKIAELKKNRDQLREELEAFNLPSVEAVKRVREGLPEGMRALPGIMYEPGEGGTNYWARYDRLKVGLGALTLYDQAIANVTSAVEKKTALSGKWSELLGESADALNEISEPEGLSLLKKGLVVELEVEETRLAELQKELRDLRNERRFAISANFSKLDSRVAELEGPEEELNESVEGLREDVERQVTPLLAMTDFIKTTQSSIRELAQENDTSSFDKKAELLNRLESLRPSFRQMDASWQRYFLGDGEWGLWLGPIFQWLVLVFLGYLVFMTFNNLIYRQWAHHEKLMYPIAEVTTILAADGSDPSDRGPPIYKSGLFWFGFTLASGVLWWNYLANNDIIPNVNPIRLQEWVGNYVGGSFLSGAGHSHFVVVFAIIGIAFLVPANISFSVWFCEVFVMGLYVVMAWLGYGVGRQTVGNYLRSSLGGGAMLVFGIFTLWTCRHFLLCAMRTKVLNGLEADEKKELRMSSWLFLGGVLSLALLLTIQLEVNFFHTILYMLMALIVTIAMIRAVAEAGILGLETHFGPFALLTKVFGTAKVWTAPHLFAPLMVYNSLLVGSLKGFIAPGMANAFKIRERMRIKRLAFHGAVWTGIIVAVGVSTVTLIMLSYDVGANNLNGWLNGKHGHAPGISSIMSTPIGANPKEVPWIYAGAIIMTVLLIARRSFFWLPHPLGMVVLINPVMMGFWASFMIGWIAKSVVSKYCSEEQYLTIRCFFVGMIVGHLFAALLGWDKMNWHWG